MTSLGCSFSILPTGWHEVRNIDFSSHVGLMQNIRIYHECEGRMEKSIPRITVWHHEACLVMTNGDPEGRIFYPTLARTMDSFFWSPLFLFFVFK